MNKCFSTVVDESYVDLIPIYIHAIRSWSNDNIVIFLRGEIPEAIRLFVSEYENVKIVERYAVSLPLLPSVTASIRFLCCDEYLNNYDYVMITDIDMLLLVDPWNWYIPKITESTPFVGHHGAWNLPSRLHICKAWRGIFERVSGGVFCVSKLWWNKTRSQRTIQLEELKSQKEHYREEDEVFLCRVIKNSRLRVPSVGAFPHDYRGVHLGDFKFQHRWINMKRMQGLLTDNVCKKYIKLRQKAEWKDIVSNVLNNGIKEMLKNLDAHISERFRYD